MIGYCESNGVFDLQDQASIEYKEAPKYNFGSTDHSSKCETTISWLQFDQEHVCATECTNDDHKLFGIWNQKIGPTVDDNSDESGDESGHITENSRYKEEESRHKDGSVHIEDEFGDTPKNQRQIDEFETHRRI